MPATVCLFAVCLFHPVSFLNVSTLLLILNLEYFLIFEEINVESVLWMSVFNDNSFICRLVKLSNNCSIKLIPVCCSYANILFWKLKKCPSWKMACHLYWQALKQFWTANQTLHFLSIHHNLFLWALLVSGLKPKYWLQHLACSLFQNIKSWSYSR